MGQRDTLTTPRFKADRIGRRTGGRISYCVVPVVKIASLRVPITRYSAN